MRYFKSFLLLGLLVILVCTSGCLTWHAKLDDMSAVFSEPDNIGVPKIIISDLVDKRRDTTLVGRISALNLATETPVNVIITNRIASKLKYAGFNVKKVESTVAQNTRALAAAIRQSKSKLVFSGSLDHFYIESSDAILETAKGRVSFRVNIIDITRKVRFNRTYSAYTEKHIGLGGGYASEELIEKTIDATVDKLFDDPAFKKFLLDAK